MPAGLTRRKEERKKAPERRRRRRRCDGTPLPLPPTPSLPHPPPRRPRRRSTAAKSPDDSGEQPCLQSHPSLIYLRRILGSSGDGGSGANHSSASWPATSPSSPNSGSRHRRHDTKKRVRNWFIGFIVGAVAGIASGIATSVAFRLLTNCIRGRYRNPNAPRIYSKLINRAEDLSFLSRDDALADLELIGEGGCGKVYKAQLPGRLVAVKMIPKSASEMSGGGAASKDLAGEERGRREIWSEIRTVGRIRHRNVLPLLAHVPRRDCDLLIYEYMKNGSLDAAIGGAAAAGRRLGFRWPERLRVAAGVAAGLEYLHAQQIVHRDLKPANILLGEDLEARIGDFGMAKQIPEEATHGSSSKVVGTMGYIAPEYHQQLRFTDKSDVYGLGVVMAALVTGKLPSDEFFRDVEQGGIVQWVRNAVAAAGSAAAGVVDPAIAGEGDEEEQQMMLMLRIACFCTAESPKDRPTAKEVRCMIAQIEQFRNFDQ